MQRDGIDHALRVIRDRGHENGPTCQASIFLHLRDMLVFQAQAVKLKIRGGTRLISRDHGFAAAGIAGHRIHCNGKIRRHDASINQGAQHQNGAGRVAAGVGNARCRGNGARLIGREFRQPINPIGINPIGG